MAAQALVARWIGVPSRVGFGYDGGDRPVGEGARYLVSEKHGIVYPEFHFGRFGWLPVIGSPKQAPANQTFGLEERESITFGYGGMSHGPIYAD